MEILSKDNPIFTAYAFYASVLVLKMLAMSALTARQRFRKRVFANPEDTAFKGKVKYDDPDIERVRRAHQNDLENIIPFLIVGFLYILTNPSAFIAVNIFRIGAISRILHTIVYAVVVIPQPARFLACGIPYFLTAYMGIQVLLYFL